MPTVRMPSWLSTPRSDNVHREPHLHAAGPRVVERGAGRLDPMRLQQRWPTPWPSEARKVNHAAADEEAIDPVEQALDLGIVDTLAPPRRAITGRWGCSKMRRARPARGS